MNSPIQSSPAQRVPWQWPVDITAYDRNPQLSESEREALESRFHEAANQQVKQSVKAILHRLLRPIEDVLTFLDARPNTRYDTVRIMLFEMHRRGTGFWGWTGEEWLESTCPDPTTFALRYGRSCDAGNIDEARRFLPILSYLFHLPPAIDAWLQLFKPYALTRKNFGKAAIEDAGERLTAVLQSWGYHQEPRDNFRTCVCYLLLRNRRPHLEGLTSELLETIAQDCTIPSVLRNLYRISRALCALGIIERTIPYGRGAGYPATSETDGSVSEAWLAWCQRWRSE